MEVLKSSYTYTMTGSFLSYKNVPRTVIKMLHITITSFHINLYANKSYVIGADPSSKTLSTPPPKFKILENTLSLTLAWFQATGPIFAVKNVAELPILRRIWQR